MQGGRIRPHVVRWSGDQGSGAPARRAQPRAAHRAAGRGPADLRQRHGLPAGHRPAAPHALARPPAPAGLARGRLAGLGGRPGRHRLRLRRRPRPVVVRGGPARAARRRPARRSSGCTTTSSSPSCTSARTPRAAASARVCCGRCWPAPDRSRVLLSTPEYGDQPPGRAWQLYRRLGFRDVLRDHRFTGDFRPFAVLGRELPLDPPAPADERDRRRRRPDPDGTMVRCRPRPSPAAAAARPARGRHRARRLRPGPDRARRCSPTTRSPARSSSPPRNAARTTPGPPITVPADLESEVDVSAYRQDGYAGSVLRFDGLTFDAGRAAHPGGRAGRRARCSSSCAGPATGCRSAGGSTSRRCRWTGPTSSSRSASRARCWRPTATTTAGTVSWTFTPGEVGDFNAVVAYDDPNAPVPGELDDRARPAGGRGRGRHRLVRPADPQPAGQPADR